MTQLSSVVFVFIICKIYSCRSALHIVQQFFLWCSSRFHDSRLGDPAFRCTYCECEDVIRDCAQRDSYSHPMTQLLRLLH